jgi:hypothetical protein
VVGEVAETHRDGVTAPGTFAHGEKIDLVGHPEASKGKKGNR